MECHFRTEGLQMWYVCSAGASNNATVKHSHIRELFTLNISSLNNQLIKLNYHEASSCIETRQTSSGVAKYLQANSFGPHSRIWGSTHFRPLDFHGALNLHKSVK